MNASTGAGRHGPRAPVQSRRDGARLLTAPTRSDYSRSRTRSREPDLVRHGPTIVSPFTFYRGAARIMAADPAGTPTADLSAQLWGLVPAPPVLYLITITLLRWLAPRGSAERQFT